MKLFSKSKSEDSIVEEISQTVQAVQEESVQPVQERGIPAKTKVPLTHRTSAKAIAFILAIVMALLAFASAIGAIFMIEEELYVTSEWSYKNDAMRNLAEGEMYTLIYCLTNEDTETGEKDAMNYLSDRNIASVEIVFSEGHRNNWTYDDGTKKGGMEYSVTWYHVKHKESGENWYSQHNEFGDGVQPLGTVEATIRLADEFVKEDPYWFVNHLISVAYALRYWVYAIGGTALIIAIACFIFLMCASGRRNGLPDAHPGWGTKIPLDLLTGAVLLAAFLLIQIMVEASYFHSAMKQALAWGAGCILLMIMALGWCMSFATRIKLGGWWKNTLCFYALRLSWRLLKKLWVGVRIVGISVLRGFRGLGSGILALLRGIPLARQAVYLYLCFVVIELLLFLLAYAVFYVEGIIVIWTLLRIVLLPTVILYALMLRKLQKGGEALATGDLSYQVDTTKMPWSYKAHGENLNRIGEGMAAAVDQRLKSERMKTELITNVSHDIKTPLTSIINYSDLIEKEQCDNPTITEYAGVLHRQSERLKRLIDDLVEASKASTGNLEILLAPCEVGVMLTQTAGEYEQRLKEKDLELITKQPEAPIKILADGRRLWRVFDNLMNNVCKYAQRGTRVYLTLEEQNGHVIISFKNISREPLNLSSDELMERFVQGDTSRNSDGNGLGLSIAKSLTELQNGTMELTTDGDLFKVVLHFPTIS